jgi:uncharacterized protein (TIGR00297 family)
MDAPDLMDVVVTLVMSCGLAGAAYMRGVLDLRGTLVASIMGIVIGFSAGWEYVLLLLLYLITSFAVTLYGYQAKKAAGVAEGKKGERGWRSVLANGVIPTFLALLHAFDIPGVERWMLSLLFVTAIAAAAADTAASELGVLTRDPVLITRPSQQVRPGTDGGISVRGQGYALAASAYTVLIGVAVFILSDSLQGITDTVAYAWLILLIPIAIGMGFISCQIDSVLGATLETSGHLGKNGVNLVSIGMTTVITFLLVQALV